MQSMSRYNHRPDAIGNPPSIYGVSNGQNEDLFERTESDEFVELQMARRTIETLQKRISTLDKINQDLEVWTHPWSLPIILTTPQLSYPLPPAHTLPKLYI